MSSQQQFVEWVKQNDPYLYNVAVARYKIKQNMSGIADFFKSVTETIKEVAPAITQLQSQKKILGIQVKRAEQGLPPLNMDQYQPTIRIAAAMTPEMEASAQRVAIESVKTGVEGMKPIFFGALILGAFFLLKRK